MQKCTMPCSRNLPGLGLRWRKPEVRWHPHEVAEELEIFSSQFDDQTAAAAQCQAIAKNKLAAFCTLSFVFRPHFHSLSRAACILSYAEPPDQKRHQEGHQKCHPLNQQERDQECHQLHLEAEAHMRVRLTQAFRTSWICQFLPFWALSRRFSHISTILTCVLIVIRR